RKLLAEGTQSAKVGIHKDAVYKSRLLKYDGLPEPVNRLPVKSKGIESSSTLNTGNDDKNNFCDDKRVDLFYDPDILDL
ncbi:1050_t:CDS:2, partial [Diversispora eburnea]